MALDLPLPRHVLVHGHWTMNKAKMSKSTGNVVNPFFAIDRFSVDVMRFFLTLRGPLIDDSNYENNNIVNDYKKYLQYGVGNVYQRLMGVARLKLRPSIDAAKSGFSTEANENDMEFEKYLQELPAIVDRFMEAFNSKAALRELVDGAMKVPLPPPLSTCYHRLICWKRHKITSTAPPPGNTKTTSPAALASCTT